MRSFFAAAALALCAVSALSQVTLPGSLRRPDRPEASQPVTPLVEGERQDAKSASKPIPPSFTGNLPPLAAATPLSDETLSIESIGMTMSLPAGSVMVQGADGDGTVYQIVDENRKWTIEVKVRQTSRADITVHDVAELTLDKYKQLSPTVRPGLGTVETKIESAGTLLQRLTDFSINGLAQRGERIYFAAPAGNSGRLLMGCTILKPLPTTFVFIELSCQEPDFQRARGAYEVCVATARFEDPTKAMASRASSLAAGTEFLSHLTEERLMRVADGQERWYRWSRPSRSSDASREMAEVGYRIITVNKGRRSDIGAGGNTGRDNPFGLVVNTQVRLLQFSAGGKVNGVVDSDTKAFVSSDRKEEAWITTTAVRDLKTGTARPVTYSETGVRNGQSLTIVNKAPDKPDSVVQPVLRASQYISVAEAQILGSLLVMDSKDLPPTADTIRELGFYSYRADAGTVSLRRETISRDASRGNTWTVRTRLRDEKSSSVNLYRDDGTLLRAELPDGSTWEPIEPEALLKIWKGKNLPVK